jgi:multicomponent Na+:H+ antiporter subunit C
MESILSLVVGLFFAAGIYLILSRQLVRVLLGVSILGNGVNLLIFTAGRLTEAAPPVLASNTSVAHAGGGVMARATAAQTGPLPSTDPATGEVLGGAAAAAAGESIVANPLPQALILTAIVIAFSIFAFLLVLTFRAYQSLGTQDVNEMRVAEPAPKTPPLGY